MNNPRVTAIISGIAALLLGWRIFSPDEAPSSILSILQWALFLAALVGLVGSLVQMSRK